MKAADDKTEIKRIYSDASGWITANKNVKIISYWENGEYAPVLWFKILFDGKIQKRINGKFVSVIEYF